MAGKDNRPEDAADLRRQAEERARETAARPPEHLEAVSSPVGDFQGSSEETRRMLHELRVHQIELEMQNEELRRAQADLDAARARYLDLYELAPVGYCTLSETGLILEANLTAATLLGVARGALVAQPISRFILEEDQDIYYLHRKQLFETGAPQAYELRMVKKDGTPFWARLEAAAAQAPSTSSGQAPSTSSLRPSSVQAGQDADGVPCSRVVMSDISERKRTEEVQAFLAQTPSGTADEPFFNALARYLARSLGMDFVCIDRLGGDGLLARTVSVWSDGHFEDNVTYALKDTPCGDVVGKAVCCFPSSVRQFFPRDQALQDLRAESYIGVTLWGHTGQPIGLIAVIGRRPLANRPLAEATLKLVAVRAAGELERLEAEEVLRESESRFRQLAESLPQLVWTCRPDGLCDYLSPHWIEFTGVPETQQLAHGWLDQVHPDDRSVLTAAWNRAVATGEPLQVEFRIRHHRGDYHWFDTRATALRDAAGRVVKWFGMNMNITDRKGAEQAVRVALDRYRSFLDVTGTIGWTTDAGGEVVEDLPSWRRFTGQSLEEIQGWGWSKALHPDDLARTSEVWRKAVKAHTAYETEYRIRRHDGVFRDFLARGVPALNEDGSIREWVGTCIDITERKEAEEEIRSLARFPGENPNPILRLNRDGVILYANEVGGVVLETWRCGIGDRAPDPWADTIQGALERQLRTTVDLTCGDRIYMLFVTPIAEAGYVNLYATDITEQKRAEEALRQAHDRLEQAVRERTAELSRAVETLGWQAGQLRALATELTLAEQRERRRLAGLLHDGLQQLLVAARLRAQMLGRSDDPKIQQGSREIAELLAEALADARSLAGELSPPTLQRGDLLPALEWLARWMLEKHHFTVAIHPPVEALPALPEDLAVLLYQGVRELLLNAVKHAQVAAAEVTFIPAGNALTLAVADAGVGFDSRRLRAEGGTQSGFGLLGIRERLGLAGGRLEIASAPGRGSRFTLTVPLHPAPADPAPSHTPIDPDSVPSAGTGTGQDAE